MRSDDLTHALIMAHRRGVSVRVVIDRLNANPRNPNPGFERLTNALKFGQKKRPQNMKSFTRRCVSACRAPGGIAHVKFYLFSKIRKTKTKSARDIVMYGSANATDLAAYAQWNDLYTMRGQGSVYREFSRVFKQMTQDRNVDQPFLTYQHGNTTLDFYPYKGAGTKKDPLMEVLNDIDCKGATDGTGTKGHTRLRIAQTSMWGDRGIMIARRLRVMWQRGCDIKIVYAVLGNNVLWVLRHTTRGKVPIKQIAQDFNRDGVYDRYLHMKNMGVSGVYAGADQRQRLLERLGQLDVGGAGQRRGRGAHLLHQADARLQQLGRLPLRPPADLLPPAARLRDLWRRRRPWRAHPRGRSRQRAGPGPRPGRGPLRQDAPRARHPGERPAAPLTVPRCRPVLARCACR